MNSTFKFSFTKSDLDKIFWRFTSNDTRYEVKENSKMPYSAIGLLKIEYCNTFIKDRLNKSCLFVVSLIV